MASLNRVILICNLTRDPELKFTPGGTAYAKFGAAVNSSYTNRDGEKVEDTDFFNVTAWGKTGELCEKYLHKGSPVAIEGKLKSHSWETEDGQKRTAVEVNAQNVQFLGGGKKSERQEPVGGPVEEVDLGDEDGW